MLKRLSHVLSHNTEKTVPSLSCSSGVGILNLLVPGRCDSILKNILAKHLLQINTLRPRQNGRHFADDIFKCIFLNENVWIPIKISLKFAPQGPINNIPALVQIMAWCRSSGNPLSGPMMVRLPTHICVTRPQWVKRAILGNCSQMNATKHLSWWVNIASNNGLLWSDINPFPEPMLTYIYVATRPSWMKMCLLITLLNELMFWRNYMSDSLITVHIWQILPQLKLRNSVTYIYVATRPSWMKMCLLITLLNELMFWRKYMSDSLITVHIWQILPQLKLRNSVTYIYVATRPSWMKMCLLITLLNELMFWRKYMSDSLITVHIWQILPQLKLRNSVSCMFLLSSWDEKSLSDLLSQQMVSQSMALRWRHNGRVSVSNHQPHDCLLNRLFRRRSKKDQSSASLAFVWGIHRGPVNSPHKWPVTRKMFSFDDVIMAPSNTENRVVMMPTL